MYFIYYVSTRGRYTRTLCIIKYVIRIQGRINSRIFAIRMAAHILYEICLLQIWSAARPRPHLTAGSRGPYRAAASFARRIRSCSQHCATDTVIRILYCLVGTYTIINKYVSDRVTRSGKSSGRI